MGRLGGRGLREGPPRAGFAGLVAELDELELDLHFFVASATLRWPRDPAPPDSCT